MNLFVLTTWVQARARRTDEIGASLVEYGLLVALIAIVAIVAMRVLGTRVSGTFSNASNEL